MTPLRIVLGTALAAVGILVFAGIGATALGIHPAEAHAFTPGFAGHSGQRGHGGPGGRHGDPCTRLSPAHVAAAEAWVAASLELDDTQRAAFAPLVATARAWTDEARGLCSGGRFDDVPAALGTTSTLLTRSAAALDRLAEQYAAFEATLDERQRAEIAAHFARHTTGHANRHHGSDEPVGVEG